MSVGNAGQNKLHLLTKDSSFNSEGENASLLCLDEWLIQTICVQMEPSQLNCLIMAELKAVSYLRHGSYTFIFLLQV